MQIPRRSDILDILYDKYGNAETKKYKRRYRICTDPVEGLAASAATEARAVRVVRAVSGVDLGVQAGQVDLAAVIEVRVSLVDLADGDIDRRPRRRITELETACGGGRIAAVVSAVCCR